jgi:hypothetical protein
VLLGVRRGWRFLKVGRRFLEEGWLKVGRSMLEGFRLRKTS